MKAIADRIDYIRTLMWVNGRRLRARKLPLLRMPKDEGYGYGRTNRYNSCPVAKALEAHWVAQDYYKIFYGDSPLDLPNSVQRYIRRQDAKAQKRLMLSMRAPKG